MFSKSVSTLLYKSAINKRMYTHILPQKYAMIAQYPLANFARVVRRKKSKSQELLSKVTEKKSLDDELQQYQFKIDGYMIKQLQTLNTIKGVLRFYNESNPKELHPIFKVHVLGKIVRNIPKERINPEVLVKHEDFQNLYSSMRASIENMDAKGLSSFILYSSYLGVNDQQVLEYAKDKITVGNFRMINPQDLSHFLLGFAKAGYMTEYLSNNILRKLSENQPFNMFIANRNLWACYKLGIYNKDLFDKFELILEQKKEFLSESIVVNSLRTLTHFEHLDQNTRSLLTRHMIENIDSYKVESLASI